MGTKPIFTAWLTDLFSYSIDPKSVSHAVNMGFHIYIMAHRFWVNAVTKLFSYSIDPKSVSHAVNMGFVPG